MTPTARLVLTATTRAGRPELTTLVLAEITVLLGSNGRNADASTTLALVSLVLGSLTDCSAADSAEEVVMNG